MKERKYIIIQTNFRDKDGNPLDVKSKENIIDGMLYYGANWWHDGGEHKLGDDPLTEVDRDVEFDYVELSDGSEYLNGLMDVIATSYDVEIPEKTEKMKVVILAQKTLELELTAEQKRKLANGDLLTVDLYYHFSDQCHTTKEDVGCDKYLVISEAKAEEMQRNIMNGLVPASLL